MLFAIMAIALQVQAAQVASHPGTPETAKEEEKTDAASRCVAAGDSPDARVSQKVVIAPGAPPLLSFRYFEGKLHHRFNNMDLMLDDAGH